MPSPDRPLSVWVKGVAAAGGVRADFRWLWGLVEAVARAVEAAAVVDRGGVSAKPGVSARGFSRRVAPGQVGVLLAGALRAG